MCFSLALAYVLALASVVNYDRKWRYNLERHLLTTLAYRNMFIIQATVLHNIAKLFLSVIYELS
jgi:hypothetical protein